MQDSPLEAIYQTLHRLLVNSGLLRPAPTPLQIAEIVGRAYMIVPLGLTWPGSCLYYASQDPKLERDLLLAIYDRKVLLDGGISRKDQYDALLALPEIHDVGWITALDRAKPTESAWGEDFRTVTRGAALN